MQSDDSVVLAERPCHASRARLPDGTDVQLRPIRPDDRERELAFFESLSEQSRHWRFLQPIRVLPEDLLQRFINIDYQDEMALVAMAGADDQAFLGVARYIRETDTRAEFAIVVTDAWQRRGVGRVLMRRLIAHADQAGLEHLVGYVHRQNVHMVHFLRSLGFRMQASTDEPGLLVAHYHLNPPG